MPTPHPSRRVFARNAAVLTGGALVAGSGALGNSAFAADRSADLANPAVGADPWGQVPSILAQVRPPTFPPKGFNTGLSGMASPRTPMPSARRSRPVTTPVAGG